MTAASPAANIERPGARRLLADIEAGLVDCVLVNKVDRLSRSLLDFGRLMETFDKHRTAFVSVTQQFNTASSMGRLVLNVLLSFAQFEREIISERTRDKIAAARRKGKWSGGHPILGYDVDERSKLIVNEAEAKCVRAIFALYLKHPGLISVVQELARRGWGCKRWITRKGHAVGGKPFTKTSLHYLLTNVAYIGQVRYKQEVHAGEHTGIVDLKTWQRVQTKLRRHQVGSLHGRSARGGASGAQSRSAPLRGLIRCVPCGSAMTPSQTRRHGQRLYRYYTCSSAQKRGWHTCPSKSVRAEQLENLILQQIRVAGQDPQILARTLPEDKIGAGVDLQQRLWQRQAFQRDLAAWEVLPPDEQAQLMQRLIARIEYDGSSGKVAITFHDRAVQDLTAPTPNKEMKS